MNLEPGNHVSNSRLDIEISDLVDVHNIFLNSFYLIEFVSTLFSVLNPKAFNFYAVLT
jgi:hypothetical protein